MKKLLCILLLTFILAGCSGQAVAPTPTAVITPSPTPEATATPEPTPTPTPAVECAIPPLGFIPAEQLVVGEELDIRPPTMDIIPVGEIWTSKYLHAALEDPENEGKYFAVAACVEGIYMQVIAYKEGISPAQWFEKRGFRIVEDAVGTVRMIGTKEMIRGLKGKCPGMGMTLTNPENAGVFDSMLTNFDTENTDFLWWVDRYYDSVE